MRGVRIWALLLGITVAVVEGVEYDERAEAVVVSVRPRKATKRRCGQCGRRCPGYDQGEGRRRWRALDLGVVLAYLEADAPRVNCPTHGPTVAQFTWARHGAGHTYAFDDTVAWLATHTSKSAVRQLCRVAWRTVGSIITRVAADAEAEIDRFANLTRIGIDEISYRRGHNYLTVVVSHDTGLLLWVGVGRSKDTLRQFFDLLGQERSQAITLVSADGAEWIDAVVKERARNATVCTDPFHVVKWCGDALDEVRREVWNAARQNKQKALAKELKGARFALWKRPADLTERQEAKLAWIAKTNERLYRAYLISQQLRQVFALKGEEGIALLTHWLAWACRCRIPAIVECSKKVRRHRKGIEDGLRHGLSNARVESVNTKLRLLMRVAFGFRSTGALIGLAMLDLGGLCPDLPGRG